MNNKIWEMVNLIIPSEIKEEIINIQLDIWDIAILFIFICDKLTDEESLSLVENIDKNNFDYKITKIKLEDLFTRIWNILEEQNGTNKQALGQIAMLMQSKKLDLLSEINQEIRKSKGEKSLFIEDQQD